MSEEIQGWKPPVIYDADIGANRPVTQADVDGLVNFKSWVKRADAHFQKEASLLKAQERESRLTLDQSPTKPLIFDSDLDGFRSLDVCDAGFFGELGWAIMRMRRAIQELRYDGKVLIADTQEPEIELGEPPPPIIRGPSYGKGQTK